MNQYSFAICPPPHILYIVRDFKLELKAALGARFGSVNSDAHVTFDVFRCKDSELRERIHAVQAFCRQAFASEISFDSFGHYPNGAFFLNPDSESHTYIRYLMAVFHKRSSSFVSKRSNDPHMSIARQLTDAQMQIAYRIFGDRTQNLTFLCDEIALRKFNRSRMQYDVEARFPFSGSKIGLEVQSKLDF